MAPIAIDGVRKVYPGPVEAIPNLSLEIADGELCVLVGPSGCGKSTLLRMVAGLEEITGGEIRIGGRRVNDLEPAERDIAMVFQNYALYPHMTVYDNMAYGLRNRGVPKAEIRALVDEAAGILGLSALLARKPRQLSGGQRQRVAMGRAIVRKPQVFLFDEPLSNLDAKLRSQMRVEIKRLQRRLATTSLYVTHDQVEAMTLGDRLLIMNHGIAEQVGTPMDVYHRPATRFVAGFIGSPMMNFLPGRVAGDGRGVHLPGGWLLATAKARGHAGRPVTVGIRPEHLQPAATGTDSDTITLRTELIEVLGADTLVHGRLDGHDDTVIARLPGSLQVAAGDNLPLAAEPGTVHLFDETERAIGHV
ncbi:MAG: sn-glycerol-3-phosphate ABC transporter ATP-binding protein UgpC [Alphaproteobacteria bacterium]|jgi:sn-glycerol 3-phosphate transport system ATP-binding protein|nr:sn-glycerol-3-phosphate ABC transporter ATP-binding protein UgpC [Alphaproteobacteria bacterium]